MALKGVTQREQGLLEASGLWEPFCDYRKKLTSKGLIATEASACALLAWMPDGVPSVPVVAPAPSVVLPEEKEPDHDSLPLAPEGLAGKTAMEPEVARWVARNIDNPAASPEDCPDPFAWTLLRMCRQDPSVLAMFVKDIWTKLLMAQARQGEEDTGGRMDGTPTLELIQRIRVLRDESNRGNRATEARQAHTLKSEGSTPSPAIPIEFNDYDGEDA